jgi:O-antigen ligase
MIYLLGGYMWLFIHRPFEVWPWLGDLHVERVYMLITIAYWALCVEKLWTSNRLNPAFAFLALSIMASAVFGAYASGSPLDDPTVEGWLKVAVFYVLVMSSVREERDLKILVTIFLVSMGLYMAHSYREFLCGRNVYAMGMSRMVGVDKTFSNPNSFAATVVYGIPMVYPVWLLARNRWQRLLVVGYVGLSLLCILLTGSRSAFAGVVLLVALVAVGSRYRLRWALLACIAVPVVWANLRGDLQNRYLTLIDPSYGPANARASAEDRERSFSEGIELWKQHPVTGVGPGCAGKATASGSKLFNLYGQVLAELGTLGALAMLMVIGGVIANGVEMRRLTRHSGPKAAFPRRVAIAVLATLLLLLVLGWGGDNLYRYTWLWFGAFQAIALYCVKQGSAEWKTTTTLAIPSPLPAPTAVQAMERT